MVSVVIIGLGNVATHLTDAFTKVDDINVSQINSRNLEHLKDADITIIAISDDVIPEISSQINNSFVVHTSGSVSLNSLNNMTDKGVFYPLQTFSKDREVDFSEVPFCIEAENPKKYALLENLARSIGKKVYKIDSEQRKKLHLAAVFVNNFTNHLYHIGNDICDKNDIPFEVLQPLIKETAAKIEKLSPKTAQTGPAKRNDAKTIKNHLELLNKQQLKIYKVLTTSIQKSHGKKL